MKWLTRLGAYIAHNWHLAQCYGCATRQSVRVEYAGRAQCVAVLARPAVALERVV